MNKKQRNRKAVKQNKRNRMVNRRYSSTIKSLSKIFLTKIKSFETEKEEEKQKKLKSEAGNLIKNLYSIIDKAVKKDVIHKNTAARKKSRFGSLFFLAFINKEEIYEYIYD